MGNIIDFNSFMSKKATLGRSAFYDQEDFYLKRIEDTKLLLPVFMEAAEEALGDAGFKPDMFVISRDSMKEYLSSLFDPKAAGKTYDGPSYDFVSRDKIVRLITHVDVEEGEVLDFSCELYKTEGYLDGNHEWLYYDFEGHIWEIGPGDDFFDAAEILQDHNSK